ncbi:nucleotide exchange factor GrpE [Mycoplasma todarodis]|uniref:nucleotide exchange factor GrpE n=1 Tax=Mycoplasma todarodis TaxID=1937191 RepID=UPI003B29DAFC
MSDKKDKKIKDETTQKVEIKIEQKKEKKTKQCKDCLDKKKLEKEIKLLKEKNSNLEKQIIDLKQENVKAQEAFLEQAKTFQSKAKEKVEEFKSEHKTKMDEEVSHIKKYATSKFFKEMTEPWLNLQLAVEFGEKQDDPGVQNYVVGFKMLLKQIDSIMEGHGLTKIAPNVGEDFNPETMDAISTTENEEMTDKVMEIKKNGFKHHDRVIKPATVVIGK